MREDIIVEQATAREIIHEDVELLHRFGVASLTVVFELPLSDVTVVNGEKAVLDCRVAVTPAATVFKLSCRQTYAYTPLPDASCVCDNCMKICSQI